MTISIDTLRGPAGAFAALTFPRYRPFLEEVSDARLAVGARSDGRPIGLALAAWSPHEPQARLFSLMVERSARRQGIGSCLLAACETLVAGTGRAMLGAYYSSRLAEAESFAALLAGRGWSAPSLLELRCAARAGDLATAMEGWPGMHGRLLKDCRLSFAPWGSRSNAEAAEIERLAAMPGCPPGLRPQRWRDETADDVSLVLRDGGRPIGWILARLDQANGAGPPTLTVASAYVLRDLWRSGILVTSYHHVLRRHAERFGPDARVRFSTAPDYPGMMALTRRRIAAAALWVDEWLMSTKRVPA